ncbi:MAG: MbnP family copper-binding protein [Hyphomonadaceae bacterium]
MSSYRKRQPRRGAHLRTLAAATAVLASGCTTTATRAGEQAIQINFEARVGSKPVHCGERYPEVGASKATILLQDFRIYVSEVRLVSSDGQEVPVRLTPDNQWQNDSVALLDFENATGNCNGNPSTNSAVKGVVPKGDYTGLIFEIGVPFSLNHRDPTLAAAPLNYSGLTWPWRVGYKFTTIDLETANKLSDGTPPAKPQTGMSGMVGMNASGFSIHLGSTNCGAGSPTTPPTSPCENPNRPTYRLNTFNPKSQHVVLDLAALLANTDVTINAPGSASGCMSFVDDDDCISIMSSFGLTFRGKASAGQTFVKAS